MFNKNSLYTPAEIAKMQEEVKKGTTQEDVLLSPSYRAYYERIAKMITNNKNIEVYFYKAAETAYTDGRKIVINPLLFPDLKFEEIMLVNLGFLAHEIFHLLFTDFNVLHTKVTQQHKWKYFMVLKDINNIVEDSAIELFGTNYYEGDFKTAIIFLNKTIFNMATDLEVKDLNSIIAAMSQYGSYGKIKGSISPSLQELWQQITTLMNKARHSVSCKKRWDISEEIYNLLLPLIEKEAENYKTQQQKADNFASSPSRELTGTGEKQIDVKISEDFQDEMKGEPEDKDTSSQKDGSKEEGNGKEKEGKAKGKGTGKNENGEQQNSDSDSATSAIEEKIESLKGVADKIKDKVIAEIMEEEMEKGKREKIKDLLEDVDFGDIHANIEQKIEFYSADTSNKGEYEKITQEYGTVISIISSRLKIILKYAHDDMLRGQRIGTFATSQATRLFTDQRVFQREVDKSKPSVAFSILVDESGSMYNRMEHARNACVVFTEVCKQLNIPLAIIGYTANFNKMKVVHHHVFDFDSPERFKYNIMNLSPREDNRDGFSVRYAGEYLLKRRSEETKVLIVISDGEPLHGVDRYYWKKGNDDLIKNVEYLEKRGVKVIALNIGGSTVNLSKLYKTCIDVADLTLLPNKLLDILKKYFK